MTSREWGRGLGDDRKQQARWWSQDHVHYVVKTRSKLREETTELEAQALKNSQTETGPRISTVLFVPKYYV